MTCARTLVKTITLLILLHFISACTPLGVAIGAGATAGSIMMETRSLDDSIKDRGIQSGINQRLAEEGFQTFSAVAIDVVEGRVLLTGVVNSPEIRLNVAKHSWAEEGVEEVVNEIIVAGSIDFIDISTDTWIKTQLISAITFDGGVLATNYEISVVDGRVYLFGLSVDGIEVEQVIAHARDIPSVRSVTSHMRNVDDPIRLRRLARIADEES